jgi:hypothetical protein
VSPETLAGASPPGLAPPNDQTLWRRATDGNTVGAKARELLGQNPIWSITAANPVAAATAAVAQLSAEPTRPGVEVPMVRAGVCARADALIPDPFGGYVLRETKASTFPLKKDKITPDKPEDHHLDDLAVQAWVYQATGWRLGGIELNLLNNQWRYAGNGDYSGLFRRLSVATDVAARIAEVPGWYAASQKVLAGPMPSVQTALFAVATFGQQIVERHARGPCGRHR